MRLIVLGDIHGNITALKEVVSNAIENYGNRIDGFVFLGDYCCDFLEGEECVQLMRQLNQNYPVYAINGNRETGMVIPYKKALESGQNIDWNLDSTMGAALLSCRRMSEENLTYLSTLPDDCYLIFDGMAPLYLQHKMPLSKEKLKELKDCGCYDILTAHTHEFHDNCYSDFHLFNPGSIGLADSGIQGATYGVLTWKNNHWRIEKKHIEYNYEAQKRLVKENLDLMDRCKHWGKALIASIDTGVNVTALYMFEVKRIAREYTGIKDKNRIQKCDIHLGTGRYGNISPISSYLSERIIVGSRIEHLKFSTDEFAVVNQNVVIEDWMYDMALDNVLTNIYSLKNRKALEYKLNDERKFM